MEEERLALNRIDLCINNSNLDSFLKAAEVLEINEVGAKYNGHVHKNVVYRLEKRPSVITNYPYLVVSDKPAELTSPWVDLFIIRDYFSLKNILKKKIRTRLGLEVIVSDKRNTNGLSVGKWFDQIRELYKLCKSINCQFVMSSGASSPIEMISGRCFDSLLKLSNIKPETYWQELGEWLQSKIGTRCYVDA